MRSARLLLPEFSSCSPHTRQHRFEAAFHVFVARRPGRHADAHPGLSLPHRDTRPTRAVLLNGVDHFAGALGIAEAHDDLIEHDVVENLESARLESLGETARLRAVALDHARESRRAEALERRVYLDATRAP